MPRNETVDVYAQLTIEVGFLVKYNADGVAARVDACRSAKVNGIHMKSVSGEPVEIACSTVRIHIDSPYAIEAPIMEYLNATK